MELDEAEEEEEEGDECEEALDDDNRVEGLGSELVLFCVIETDLSYHTPTINTFSIQDVHQMEDPLAVFVVATADEVLALRHQVLLPLELPQRGDQEDRHDERAVRVAHQQEDEVEHLVHPLVQRDITSQSVENRNQRHHYRQSPRLH